jgi:ubiquitin carboxyl-terminal hydrolase 5/13
VVPFWSTFILLSQQVEEYQAKKAAVEAEGKKLKPGDIVRPEINLVDCLNLFAQTETIDDFYSSATKSKGLAYKSSRLATFPDFLFIQARKFELGPDWSPIKVDISLRVPDELDMGKFRGSGRKESEVELSEETVPAPARDG